MAQPSNMSMQLFQCPTSTPLHPVLCGISLQHTKVVWPWTHTPYLMSIYWSHPESVTDNWLATIEILATTTAPPRNNCSRPTGWPDIMCKCNQIASCPYLQWNIHPSFELFQTIASWQLSPSSSQPNDSRVTNAHILRPDSLSYSEKHPPNSPHS